jgi:hypothetical protein
LGPVYDSDGKPVGTQGQIHKLAVTLTQECDLAQDFLKRKDAPMIATELRNVLLCVVAHADELRGERDEMSRKFWETIRSNKAERYQYLAAVPTDVDSSGTSTKELIVDFKNYFAVQTVEVYRQIRATEGQSATPLAILNVPWREHLQQRFATYLGRIGLPVDHFVPESRRVGPPEPTAN